MKIMSRILVMCVLWCGVVSSVYAAQASEITGVTRLLTRNDGTFGNCMAFLGKVPAGVNCVGAGSTGWVTFSCDGTFNSKSDGRLKYDSALAAYALGKGLEVTVDDTKKHNGYCFVIDARLR